MYELRTLWQQFLWGKPKKEFQEIDTDLINNEIRLFTPDVLLCDDSAIDLDKVLLPNSYVSNLLECIRRSFKECPVNYDTPEKVAVPLSGGIDSSTAVYCSIAALGKENTVPVIMKHDYMTKGEVEDRKYAQLVLDDTKIKPVEIDITRILESLFALSEDIEDINIKNIVKAECLPRARAAAMNTYCSRYNWITIDTANLTEICLANMTKGDYCGNIDIFNDLLKSEVVQLAREVGVPDKLRYQKKRISEFHSTFDQMFGANYPHLDVVIHHYLNGNTPEETSKKLNHPQDWVQGIYKRINQGRFIDSRPISYVADFAVANDEPAEWIEDGKTRWQNQMKSYSQLRELNECRQEYMPISA